LKPQYSINEPQNRVDVTYIGEISVDDVIGLIEAAISDPGFHADMDSLSDFTQASLDWTLNEVDQLRRYVTRVRPTIGHARWAVLFSSEADASTARVFIALHNAFTDTIAIKLFKKRIEALSWLDSPKPPR